MKPIEYVQGDATRPQGPGNKIIVHICNDVGGWGKGFVLTLAGVNPEKDRPT
jgi:O-acetyl-ADP-ribose deacetylase (regulator of RNase III)